MHKLSRKIGVSWGHEWGSQIKSPKFLRFILQGSDFFQSNEKLFDKLIFGVMFSHGGSRTSAHMEGCAVDCYPLRMSLREAYIVISKSDVPFDQLIFEYARWIHLGGPKPKAKPRHQLLMIFELGHYEFFNEDDPRVK